MKTRFQIAVMVSIGFGLSSCASVALTPNSPAHIPIVSGPSEQATGFKVKPAVIGSQMMVATANPLATQAAFKVLQMGGNAMDAAIAAQMVLTLVEPQSSGIGGGAFLMHYQKSTQAISAWDGRETAPSGATESLFLAADGKPISFNQAVVGGRSVGVPGVVRMLKAAHEKNGAMAWNQLFDGAIELATNGFEISPRLHNQLAQDKELKVDPQARSYFYNEQGLAHPIGYLLKNPALAKTLKALANQADKGLHEGPIAQSIVNAVQGHPTNPGLMTLNDLKQYQARLREALCHPYRQYWICGFPPPSSGGIAVAQMLSIMEAASAPALANTKGQYQSEWVHFFAEAGRLAFADRNLYIADPDFVSWPTGLLDSGYLSNRGKLINAQTSLKQAAPGKPLNAISQWAISSDIDIPSTSHISIVDHMGNAVAMTTTIEGVFGAHVMVEGFLLNNQLTDFSFNPLEGDAKPVANRVQGNKRPRSSMAPTFVFERGTDGSRGELVLVLGSPGGSAIINYVARVLTLTLRDGLPIDQAIAMGNLGSRNGPTELEQGQIDSGIVERLKALGHETRLIEMTSGLQAIKIERNNDSSKRLTGAADPRREGVVLAR